MQGLSPEYVGELARQFLAASAFLGGVAATFLAQMLALNLPRRVVTGCILSSTAAAVAFVVSVLGATMVIAITHPLAPSGLRASDQLDGARVLAFGPFLLGVYLLLLTLGLAGWIRSRRMGWATTALAALGAFLGGWTLIQV